MQAISVGLLEKHRTHVEMLAENDVLAKFLQARRHLAFILKQVSNAQTRVLVHAIHFDMHCVLHKHLHVITPD